jgi:hypothetical protein
MTAPDTEGEAPVSRGSPTRSPGPLGMGADGDFGVAGRSAGDRGSSRASSTVIIPPRARHAHGECFQNGVAFRTTSGFQSISEGASGILLASAWTLTYGRPTPLMDSGPGTHIREERNAQ